MAKRNPPRVLARIAEQAELVSLDDLGTTPILQQLVTELKRLAKLEREQTELREFVRLLGQYSRLVGPEQFARLAALASRAAMFLSSGDIVAQKETVIVEIAPKSAAAEPKAVAKHGRYLDRKAKGYCVKCPNPAIPGRTRCTTCYAAERRKRTAERQRNAQATRA